MLQKYNSIEIIIFFVVIYNINIWVEKWSLMYANSTMGFIKVIYCPSVSPSFSYPRNSVSYTSLPVLKETSLGYF
jgi:hypothetical protein